MKLLRGAQLPTCSLLILLACASCGDDAQVPRRSPNVKPVVAWDLPDFSCTDQLGRTIGKRELAGKIWVATFFFVQCTGPCPDMIRAHAELEKEPRDIPDVRMVAFSFRPEEDTVPELAAYAEAWRADPKRWHFLRAESGKAARDLQERGFKAGDMDHHTANFFLVDRKGRVRRWWDARNEMERASLLLDIKTLAAGEELSVVDH